MSTMDTKLILNCKLTLDETINASLKTNDEIKCDIVVGKGERSVYNGKYSITPDDENHVLETKGKVMNDNLTVFKIPLWETSNDSGTTVYIGGENIYGL